MRIIASLAAIIALGTLSVVGFVAIDEARGTAEDVEKFVIVGCYSANDLNAYLRKRSESLQGSTDTDVQVLRLVRPIIDCNDNRKPLSEKQQKKYVRWLFRYKKQPVIENGKVIGLRNFPYQR